jgi:hypothetical protein
MPTTMTTEMKYGAYVMVYSVRRRRTLRTSFSDIARMMGSGKHAASL